MCSTLCVVSEITRRETAGAEIKGVFGPMTGHGVVRVSGRPVLEAARRETVDASIKGLFGRVVVVFPG